MIREAYAKINLSLDITGRREDGYHLVDMIMQTVDLHDTLEITRTETPGEDGYGVRLELASETPGRKWAAPASSGRAETAAETPGQACAGAVPAGDDNLVVRAVRLLAEEFGLKGQFRAKLTKRIPAAAGMAGGSTDAAAALILMRDLCGLPLSDEELRGRGVRLGADVPYCVCGGTMRARGIGEQLTALPPAAGIPLVIVKPDIGISTPWCYREYDRLTGEGGAAAESAGAEKASGNPGAENREIRGIPRPDTEALIRLLEAGEIRKLLLRTENVLEPVSAGAHPVIGRIRTALEEQGALRAMMTGSGPTVFAAFGDGEAADRAAEAVSRLPEAETWQVLRTDTYNPA